MASHEPAITSATFDEFSSKMQSSILKATRNSMLLPSDIKFHRTMDAEFSEDLDALSARILSMTNRLLTLAGSVNSSVSNHTKNELESEDDVVDNFQAVVVDTMDHMMEKTDMSLDEYLGRNKAPAIAINPKSNISQKKSTTSTKKGGLDPTIQHASYLPKPQLQFKRKAENNDIPWRPMLSHKFNAQVPLGFHYQDSDTEMDTDSLINLHPYRYEITHLSYPSKMFESSSPIPSTSFDSTTYKWVSTVSDLEDMLDELRQAAEIAVDLEHHSYRSYAGFLCLMQISTRQQDWLIDLLVLREEMQSLNEVFTNPKITKVFHGAESDIVWLQQNFDLYVVNLFDTFHASKTLGFPRHGLANLLEMYCDFTPDKRYQLADWRIRPLPTEMLDYARSDTHFLLYIYDNLRNALLDRALSSQKQTFDDDSEIPSSSHFASYPPAQRLVREVLAKSEETALRVYEKEYYDVEGGTGGNGWDTMARKWNKVNLYGGSSTNEVGIPGMQKTVYRKVHGWREKVAREEDESTRYVLPNHYVFQLADQPPADMPAMLRIFHFVPPVLKRRAKELLDVIREAVKEHLVSGEEKSDEIAVDSPHDIGSEESRQPEVKMDATHAMFSGKPDLPALSSTSSSLFGTANSVSLTNQNKTSTSHSVLFGTTLASTGTSQMPPQAISSSITRFAEIVRRIHSNLLIAPSTVTAASVPAAATVPERTSSNTMDPAHDENVNSEEDDDTLPSTVQVEMPFVPASRRAQTDLPTETLNSAVGSRDTVVVVGQTRQKKRKRAKGAGVGGKSKEGREGGGGGEGEEDADAVMFDFTSAPNILDDAPDANVEQSSAGPRKKKKSTKGTAGGEFQSGFSAPRAYSEVKSGNKSHTFR
ncbi:hypothetical protein D9757_001048 [Collybiopsis confluens]|uniref:HRDC domain-containing protein n=1 Tax=Collybiopsis confluens TaxID=2823264 RepID=A0A8H5I0J3_9AGAR|nr:hypothetical protein D9757_001048 [Collybiopsis confluens]